jgi:siroheme synthase-like protein
MKYLPIGLSVQGKKCVVVGGGTIGTRKVDTLLKAGADVYLLSPEASDELRNLAQAGAVTWIREPFDPRHLDGALLAVAATDDRDVNGRVGEAARDARVWVCDASSAERSQIIFGALYQGKDVIVAVFSDGEDPSRSRAFRDRIVAFVSEEREPRDEC